ncbi:hypothetical protein DERP_011481 [Dermatophagoides pteronyssinus]|uniref:Uncharacterized protein n=1 Tax=Dermatophagoides pteronyssinus TaxID=6956 RepID=A0ABQ8J5B8_DERPT|nr:hypothetical protein DERP_011481 [Dermatophagoides pteronyssinus]
MTKQKTVNHTMNENHTVRLIRMPLYHIDDADVLLLLDDADCHNNNMTHQKKQDLRTVEKKFKSNQIK